MRGLEHAFGRVSQIPDKAKDRENPQEIVAEVDLPPEEALARAALVVMVIVVPSFAHGDEREKPVVARIVGRLVAPLADYVRKRVDGERAVPKKDRRHEETPDETPRAE